MKVVLYLAQTVNGYIANEKDETPWSAAEFRAFYLRTRQAGNLIIGRKTYEIMKSAGEFRRCGDPVVAVLTKSKRRDMGKFIFVRSPKQAIEALRSRGFRTVTVAGGGHINSSFLREGLIDEIWLDVEPLVFGRGVPLFREADIKASMRLAEIRRISKDTVRLCYRVLR